MNLVYNNILYKIIRIPVKLTINLFWFSLIKFVRFLGRKNDDYVFLQAYVKNRFLDISPNNWGDDLNKYLLELITNKKVVFVPYSSLLIHEKEPHYLFIGSILGFYCLDNCIVCGTGIQDPNKKLIGKPKAVISVRGPLTRKVLLKNGILCPKNYGDPALLLPLFYKPVIHFDNRKKYIAFIPHHLSNPEKVLEIGKKFKNRFQIKIIDLVNYSKWTDIIDSISNSCFVLSESLHGLIVSEAYGIPNVWVEFVEHPDYWDFKFLDFYYSIGKFNQKSKKLFCDYSIDELVQDAEKWKQGSIDFKGILNSCPFKNTK